MDTGRGSASSTTDRGTHLLRAELERDLPMVVRGEGIYLFDADGRRYLDGSSGAVVANIGHGVRDVVEAMAGQAGEVAFVFRNHFTSGPAERLAARVAALAPGDLNWLFLMNSGSEATEAAARFALQYWRERGLPEKTSIVSRHMSYHGLTAGALSMSGHPDRRSGLETLLRDFPQVDPPYCYRCPLGLSPEGCNIDCVTLFERAIEARGAGRVAAVIVEPVIGAAGGAVSGRDGYLTRLRELCDRHDVLLIADEVITGFGRTGAWFGCDHDGVVPDLLVGGKGMSAGYAPVAGVIASDRLVETLRRGSGISPFGHTYSAYPAGAAACLAVLDYIERHDLVRNARERGAELRAGLEELQASHPVIGDVRGRGLLLGLELVADRASRRAFPRSAGVNQLLVRIGFQHGLVLYPAGTGPAGDALLVTPPLTITSAEVGHLLSLLDGCLADLERQLRAAGSSWAASTPK